LISLLGRTCILVALTACSVGMVTGMVAGKRQDIDMGKWSRWMAYVCAIATTASIGMMEYALLTHDFSVAYVAEVGSLDTPTWVTIVSLWSSLNGSILLWSWMLGLFLAGFAYLTRNQHQATTSWALGVAMGIGVFFCFLVAGIANPFEAVSPIPTDGPGPNPLLQNHILMVVHPPSLYLGFVGMTIPFAMGCAALLSGRLDGAWLRHMRRWMLVPWGFLSLGIVLGGWWSYEVLGWGGWWAWDPVENASFLPWLTGTAFLHSAMITQRRNKLQGWTVSLIMATFLLTILGTFMTRSGVFNSVHSFTQSSIGPVFLAFLGACLLGSVLLLAARVDKIQPDQATDDGAAPKETSFLLNNLLFTGFMFTVLIGTVYPLLNEAITGKQISVGQPYFDKMTGPIGLAIIFLMGVGPALPWGRVSLRRGFQILAFPLASGIVIVGICLGMKLRGGMALATFGLSGFALAVTLKEMASPILAFHQANGKTWLHSISTVFIQSRRRYGGHIVHIGILCIAVGHVAGTRYTTAHPLTFSAGESKEVGSYTLTFKGTEKQIESHRRSVLANVLVHQNGKELAVVQPRLNHYIKMNQPIGTPQVLSTLTEDLYLNAVNIDEAANVASFDIYIKPLIWWIWFGGGLMLLGSILAFIPSRRGTDGQETVEAA